MPYNVETVVSVINEKDNWNSVDVEQVKRMANTKKNVLTDRQVQIIVNKLYVSHVHRIFRTQMYQWITQRKEEV